MTSLDYDWTPSAFSYMASALLPKKRHAGAPLVVPTLRARWRGAAIGRRIPAGLGALSGDRLHPLYLHAASLRLMMVLVTHPRFPLPIWSLLQVRNRIAQRRPAARAARLDLAAHVASARILEKGLEVDISVQVSDEAGPVLESTNTFYARGRFAGTSSAPAPAAPAPPVGEIAEWEIRRAGVGGFARLTGDYNGIHWLEPYARAFGFRQPLAHPHRVLAQVLDRLPGVDLASAFHVEAWLKGPVYYGRRLRLASRPEAGGGAFALRVDGDERPALVGAWRAGRG